MAAVCVGTAAGDEKYFEVNSLAELNEVIGYANDPANSSHHYKIVISADIPISSSDTITTITGNVTLTTTDSANHMIHRTEADSNVNVNTAWDGVGMLEIRKNGNLTIEDNSTFILTLHGNKSHVSGNLPDEMYLKSLVFVNGGNFTMDGGCLTENYVYRGGGVFVVNGNFILKKGTISRNNATWGGGGVLVNGGIFTMYDGDIMQNYCTGEGGGVRVSDGKFIMSGGAVSDNKVGNAGGGIAVTTTGELTLLDKAEISRNSARTGGGVSAGEGTGVVFSMSGGIIKENQARQGGGGILLYDYNGGANFNMNGGVIRENIAAWGTSIEITGVQVAATLSGDAIISSPDGSYGIVTSGGSSIDTSTSDTIVPTKPQITTESLLDSEVNIVYPTQTLQASVTSTIIWSSSVLPTGLLFDNDKGIIYGTPRTAGKYTLTIKAENTDSGELSDTKTYTINVYEVITPASLIEEPAKQTNGNITVTNTTAGVVTIENGNTTIIESSNITMTVTFNETLTPTTFGNIMTVEGNVTEVLASYKPSFVVTDDWVNGQSEYILNLTLKNVTTQLPTINPAFNETLATLIEKNKPYQTIAMINGTAADLTKVNGNITEDGIEIIFKIPKSGNSLNKIKAFHVEGTTPNELDADKVILDSSSDANNYLVKVIGSTFSTYAIVKDNTKDPEPPKESHSQGSSVWLTETPTPTPTTTPTPTDTVPTDIPDVKPTQTPDSPAPILGIIAALGFGVLVLRRR